MRPYLLDKLMISDGTNSISFFDVETLLQDWRPSVGGLRGNGTWRTPMFDAGSSLVMAEYDDITDVFTLCFPPSSEDGIYDTLMDLFAMLEKARAYWTASYASEPVWIKAQGPEETNARYAVIKDWRCPSLGRAPFNDSVVNGRTAPAQDIQLTLVHGLWQSTEPRTGECVELSAKQSFVQQNLIATFVPTASGDDCLVEANTGVCNIAAHVIKFGNTAAGNKVDLGIRFRNVTIPPGSTIHIAALSLHADANQAGTTVNVNIRGERSATPAIFQAGAAGLANFNARLRTYAWVPVQDVPAWTIGSTYNIGTGMPDDIAAIVQEIIDLPGWASGNDIVIFIQDMDWNPSTATAVRWVTGWDDPVDPAPELHVYYSEGNDSDYGQEATCEHSCYVANKHNYSQLSDIYWWSAGSGWAPANLLGSGVPYALFDNPIANADLLYFGCQDLHPDSGPFCSLVFDLSVASVYSDLGAACSMTWQYWNGAWVTLTVFDNTSGSPETAIGQTHPFRELGVNSVHWAQPSDWVQTVINGILGYWVRLVANVGGGESITVPTQQNRDVYTICWPYVETASDQVDGDVGALLNVLQYGESDFFLPALAAGIIDRYPQRILIGLRSMDRGDTFTAYLNASEVQTANVIAGAGANAAFANDSTVPTGSIVQVSYAGATGSLASEADWQLPAFEHARDFHGRFRAFLRYVRTAGADTDIRVRLKATTAETYGVDGDVWVSEERDLPVVANEVLTHDFGLVTLPPGVPYTPVGMYGPASLSLLVEMQNLVAAARVINVIDLILMPADELLIEMRGQLSSLSTYGSAINEGDYLEANSLEPKLSLVAKKVYEPGASAAATWITHHAGRLQFHPRKQQRLWWFMFRADASIDLPYRAEHEMAISVKGEMAQRYFAVRGAR